MDNKLDCGDQLNSCLKKILDNPSSIIEGAFDAQNELWKLVSRQNGLVLIDEHMALYEPINFHFNEKKKTVLPVKEEYFKDFTSWTGSFGVCDFNSTKGWQLYI